MSDESNQIIDANSRLKARLRPSVPPRQTSLLKHVEEEPMREFQEHQPQEVSSPETKEQKITLVAKKSKKAAKLVPFTLRVEEKVDKSLKSICSDNGVTKETFLEAACLICESNTQVMEQVIQIAKQRRQQRKETGIQRRAKAMSKYLED